MLQYIRVCSTTRKKSRNIYTYLPEIPKKRGADACASGAITEIDAGDIRAFDLRALAPRRFSPHVEDPLGLHNSR